VRRGGIAVLAVAAASVLSACGGGGGGEQLSAEEFRQQANGICTKYEGRLAELGQPSSLDDLKDYVAKAVPIIEAGNAELNELEPPDEFADDWGRAMEINDQQLETVRDIQDAVEEGDQARVQQLFEQGSAADEEADQLAAQMGLDECAAD
jgi:hypothetical protein